MSIAAGCAFPFGSGSCMAKQALVPLMPAPLCLVCNNNMLSLNPAALVSPAHWWTCPSPACTIVEVFHVGWEGVSAVTAAM